MMYEEPKFKLGKWETVAYVILWLSLFGALIALMTGCSSKLEGATDDDRTFRSIMYRAADLPLMQVRPERFDEDVLSLVNVVTQSLENEPEYRKRLYGEDAKAFPDFYEDCLLRGYGSGSMCQQLSISTAETLARFGIRSRQIHHQTSADVGDHQFLEYYNPKTRRWRMVDPYLAIVYEDALFDLVHKPEGVPTWSEFAPAHRERLEYLSYIWTTGRMQVGQEYGGPK